MNTEVSDLITKSNGVGVEISRFLSLILIFVNKLKRKVGQANL